MKYSLVDIHICCAICVDSVEKFMPRSIITDIFSPSADAMESRAWFVGVAIRTAKLGTSVTYPEFSVYPL